MITPKKYQKKLNKIICTSIQIPSGKLQKSCLHVKREEKHREEILHSQLIDELNPSTLDGQLIHFGAVE